MRTTTMTAVAAMALLATTVGSGPSGASTAGASTGGAGAAGGTACAPTWKLVHTPAVPRDNQGADVDGIPDVLSSSDMLLAASPETLPAGSPNPEVLRWDGSSVTTMAPLPHDDLTEAVWTHASDESFDSPSDGWVLGTHTAGSDVYNFLVRWHSGRWTVVPPAVSSQFATDMLTLNEVVAVSPSSAWAVGEAPPEGSRPAGALIEHWDGTQWVTVANPAAQRGALAALTMVSARDIWAVGGVAGAGTLVEHWDGTRWQTVPSPGGQGSSLLAVSAAGPRDVWATGVQPGSASALVEHWNGVTWQVVRGLPHLGSAVVKGVYAAGPDDVWATSDGVRAKFLHWDGKTWSAQLVLGPEAPGFHYDYQGIDGSGPDDVWAVGLKTAYSDTDELQLAHLSCGRS